MNQGKKTLVALCALLLGVVLGGCSMTDKMSTFDPAGEISRMQLNVFYVTLWVSLGIFVVVGSLLVFSVVALFTGASVWGSVWGPAEPVAIWLTGLKVGGALLLYYLPLMTWLLLASAWARKLPFLHAVLPPVLLTIRARLFLGSNRFGTWLGEWLLAGTRVVSGSSVARYDHTLSFGVDNVGSFLLQPGIVVGLVATTAMILVSIRVRRWRELG